MKKVLILALTLITIFSFTACKPSLEVTENTGRTIVVVANNSAKDDFMAFGSLKVKEGEQIAVSTELKKGAVQFEFVKMEGEQSIEELPDTGKEAALTVIAQDTVTETNPIDAGEYFIRVKTAERAKGTIRVTAEKMSD